MLLSLALIFLCGFLLADIAEKLHLPRLLGMLVTGILLGPYFLGALNETILFISPDLRQIALIIILLRAGLNLDVAQLRRVGRPALLLCFVPALSEIIATVVLAPRLLHVTYLDAAIIGAVIAAVSPAVIVPKMLKLTEEGYGKDKAIPQMIMAGASVDDVFVIVLFTAFCSLAQGGSINVLTFAEIPVSIVLGIVIGLFCGLILDLLFKKIHTRDSNKVLLLLSISFLLVTLENQLAGTLSFSGLLAVMSMGATLAMKNAAVGRRLSSKFSKLWVGAELLLFVLVGASVNIRFAFTLGWNAVALILLVLVFRVAGVLFCLVQTPLNQKERLFCAIAYFPKATVQAAIGAVPLGLGLSCGNTVLTIAVLAILLTAPLGALFIDLTYQKCLTKS